MTNYSEYTVCLLDRFRVEHSGHPKEFLEYRKHEEVLAYLALNARLPVPQEQVTSTLWPTISEAAGANRLYETVHKIRRQLTSIGMGDEVIKVGRGLVFAHPDLSCDVDRVMELCDLAITEPRSADEPIIEELRRVYGEGLLPGLRVDWAEDERKRIRASYEQAIGTVMARRATTSTSTFVVPAVKEKDPAETAREIHPELMELASKMWANRFGVDREYWLQIVDLRAEDIRQTFSWAIENDAAMALDIAGHFWIYWYFRSQHSVGRGFVDQAIAIDHDRGDKYSRALASNGSAMFAARMGELGLAEERIAEAIGLWEKLGDQERYACAVHDKSVLARARGDHELALALAYQSLELQRLAGIPEIITKRLIDVAIAEREIGSLDRSQNLLDEARERIGEAAGWLAGRLHESQAVTHMYRSYGHADENEKSRLFIEAEREARSAVDLYRAVRGREQEAHALRDLGISLHWQKRFDEAEEAYCQARDLSAACGDMHSAGHVLHHLADLMADMERWSPAEKLAQQSVSLFRAVADEEGETEASGLLARVRRRGEEPAP